MMKIIVTLLLVTGLLAATMVWIIQDRDRSLWLLNTSISLLQQPNTKEHIAYGEQEWQFLDVYAQQTRAPVVVFLHGGSWRHGRKDQYYFAADAFFRKGYTVVVPDYLKYPDKRARFPSFAEDAAAALAWVKANIHRYNGDPDNLFLAGHSAGAHTSLMLATDAQYLSSVGMQPQEIRGVIGIAGPYSFVPDWEVTKAVFGPPDRYPLMDVLNYVSGDEPSTLLLHSEADDQVGQYNQETVATAMRDKGVDIEKVLYQSLDHIQMVTHLHPWFDSEMRLMQDIDRFIRARLVNQS